jgi:dephospho-CoA kinase
MFIDHGVHLIKADELAHQLMLPGTPVYAAVLDAFGAGILDTDGTISRPKLAELAFAPSQPRVAELNQLVHPAVIAEQDRWSEEIRQADPHGVAMVEAALIFEAGVRDHFDRMVVVTCNPEQKIERLARRLNFDADLARRELERRSRAQWPDEQKVRGADFVIRNDSSLEETARQVATVARKLREEAKSGVSSS